MSLRALPTLVPHVPCAIRALVSYVSRALRALVPHMPRALHALVHSALRVFLSHLSYVLLYLTCLVPCMFSGCS